MSNYPDGMPSAQSREVLFHCKNCEYSWSVQGIFDFGVWDPVDASDTDCPNCGSDDTTN
jgi:hypothetical protein